MSDKKANFKGYKAFKTWNKIGSLNLPKLIKDEVLFISLDEKTGQPLPVKSNFKLGNIDGWEGEFFCEFGQVDQNNELNGIGRIINEKGTIIEG